MNNNKVVAAVGIYVGNIVQKQLDTALLSGSVVSDINALLTDNGETHSVLKASGQWCVKNGFIHTKWKIYGVDVELVVFNNNIGLIALAGELVSYLGNVHDLDEIDRLFAEVS